MIEIKSARFLKFDSENHRVYFVLLDEENESFPMDILIGLPEVMTRETMDYIMLINSHIVKNGMRDDLLNMENIDREKLDLFFVQIIQMITHGKTKSYLEVPISNEVSEE